MNRKQLRTVAKRIPGKQKQAITKEALRALLESMFPPEKKLISRRDPQLNEMAAWGTLANADSELTGISARIIIGNKTFYERTATINWLVDRAKE